MPELRQEYLDILEKRDWSVSSYTDDGRVEIEWYSPAGEDFIICVGVEKFPDEVLDYSDSFDVDEHIAMWIEAKQNGTQGVPVAPTNIVEPIATWCPSGSYSHKHDEKNKGMFTRDRARNRAKTFPGVARAFAEQFGGQL